MATTNYLIFFGLLLFAIFGELYISQSDASQTLDEITNVKTSVEKPVYNYSESPAYISNGDYDSEYNAKLNAQRERDRERLTERMNECLKQQINGWNEMCNYDISGPPFKSQEYSKVKTIQNEWFDRNK